MTVSYPESYGSWVQVLLTATATVSGTQASTSATFILPMSSVYLDVTTVPPPGQPSPFGIDDSCADTQ
jgi:hypothetical protein